MLSFIPGFLFSKWTIVAAAILGLWIHGFVWGNQHGSYARAYRAVAKELADTNKELTALKEDDKTKEKEQAEREASAYAEFAKAAPRLKKLVIDKNAEEALGALVNAANGE